MTTFAYSGRYSSQREEAQRSLFMRVLSRRNVQVRKRRLSMKIPSSRTVVIVFFKPGIVSLRLLMYKMGD